MLQLLSLVDTVKNTLLARCPTFRVPNKHPPGGLNHLRFRPPKPRSVRFGANEA